jgi:uncharacterized protein (DUF3820 family)
MDYSLEPVIIDIWPFGKHKGEPISKVYDTDRQYINWFMMKCDFKDSWEDLVYTLKTKYNYR